MQFDGENADVKLIIVFGNESDGEGSNSVRWGSAMKLMNQTGRVAIHPVRDEIVVYIAKCSKAS